LDLMVMKAGLPAPQAFLRVPQGNSNSMLPSLTTEAWPSITHTLGCRHLGPLLLTVGEPFNLVGVHLFNGAWDPRFKGPVGFQLSSPKKEGREPPVLVLSEPQQTGQDRALPTCVMESRPPTAVLHIHSTGGLGREHASRGAESPRLVAGLQSHLIPCSGLPLPCYPPPCSGEPIPVPAPRWLLTFMMVINKAAIAGSLGKKLRLRKYLGVSLECGEYLDTQVSMCPGSSQG
jgi:hypothetical protein